ncbi:MAG: hypothetical protein ACM3X0_07350 [Bacteroidota bacterium]
MVGAVGGGGMGMGGTGGNVGAVGGMAHVVAGGAASSRVAAHSLPASESSVGTKVSISVAARNVLANDMAQIGVKASAAGSSSGLHAAGASTVGTPHSAVNVNIDVNTLQTLANANMFDQMMVALLLALLLQDRNNAG